jgi:hypothetical protein
MQQHDKDVATWARLVTDLRSRSVTPDYISYLLGYSGGNGPRDLDNFAKGRSFTMTIPEGIDVLRRYLRQVEISQEAASQRKRTAEAQDALTPKASVDQRPIDYFGTISDLLAAAVPFSRIYAQLLPGKAMPDTRNAAAAVLEAFVREATGEEGAGSVLPLREGLFWLCLAAAVDCFAQGRPASAMCEALERLPAEGKPATLSSWLHAATKLHSFSGAWFATTAPDAAAVGGSGRPVRGWSEPFGFFPERRAPFAVAVAPVFESLLQDGGDSVCLGTEGHHE